MKLRTIKASNEEQSEIVFTPAALLDLLSKVEEFNDFDLGLSEGLDGTLQLQVGQSFYDIASNESVKDVEVEDKIVDEIITINDEAYENLVEGGAETSEDVESGLIKEALKTLMIGGVVRLGKHYLQSPEV